MVLWRAGLRIGEALILAEADLDAGRGSLLVRSGKGGKRREAGMDDWGWQQLRPWLSHRTALPPGPLFCVIRRPHPRPALGRQLSPQPTAPARPPSGVRRRFAPHQLRHAHARVGVTSIYLQGIDNTQIIHAVHSRQPPMMPASAGLQL